MTDRYPKRLSDTLIVQKEKFLPWMNTTAARQRFEQVVDFAAPEGLWCVRLIPHGSPMVPDSPLEQHPIDRRQPGTRSPQPE